MYICIHIYLRLFGGSRCAVALAQPLGLYKVFFHLFLCVEDSIILSVTPPISIAHTTAILLRGFCAVYDLPPNLPLYAIHHRLLVMTISCKG